MSPEDRNLAERAVEAALFAAEAPLGVTDLLEIVGTGLDVEQALVALCARYAGRGINLVERGGHWHFQTAPDLAHMLRRERADMRRLGRAAAETLAIVAYHEPVSRAEIEAIRGVTVAKGTLDILIEAGWVGPAGRRETPGRPLTYRTTPAFLDHFGLGSLGDLPGVGELRAAGLLDPLSEADLAEVENESASA